MASDSFTDVDNTVLSTHDANWGDCGTKTAALCKIVSNRAQLKTNWSPGGGRYTTSSEDLSEIALVGGGVGILRRVAVRASATVSGYGMYFGAYTAPNYTSVCVDKNGAYLATLASGTWDATANHTLKVTASGSGPVTIRGYVDGTEVGSGTSDSSSPYASGNPGFWFAGTNQAAETKFDDWTDGAAAGTNYERSIDDALGLTDSVSRVAGFGRSIADGLALGDAINRPAGFLRTFDDTSGLTDSAARTLTLARAFADSLGLTDEVTYSKYTAYIEAINDALGLTDSVTSVRAFQRAVQDMLGLADSMTRVLQCVRALADTEALTDALTRTAAFLRNVDDSEGLADSVTRIAAFVRPIADDVGLSDSTTRVATFLRTIADNEGLADAVTKVFSGGGGTVTFLALLLLASRSS